MEQEAQIAKDLDTLQNILRRFEERPGTLPREVKKSYWNLVLEIDERYPEPFPDELKEPWLAVCRKVDYTRAEKFLLNVKCVYLYVMVHVIYYVLPKRYRKLADEEAVNIARELGDPLDWWKPNKKKTQGGNLRSSGDGQ
jgi:hypothetical protein